MSVIFFEDFNAPMSRWGNNPNNPENSLSRVPYWGVDGTLCEGCTPEYTESNYLLPAPIPSAGTIRAQVACILTTVDALEGALTFSWSDYQGGAVLQAYGTLVYLRADGSFRIRRNANLFQTVFQNTVGGLFPVDGTWFGLQIRFTIGASNSVTFTVNGVDVATLTWTQNYVAYQWDYVFIYGMLRPVGGAPPLTDIVTVDNYTLDDSDAAVSWPAGNAVQLDPLRTCSQPPLPPVNPVGPPLEIDCATHIVTIRGVGFQVGASIDLRDPNGQPVTFTVLSFSSTIILIQIAYTLAGTYCVTVTNPA